MPSSATTASRPAATDSWRANTVMKAGGRCWVTRIGTPIRVGQRGEEGAERVDSAGRSADRQQAAAAGRFAAGRSRLPESDRPRPDRAAIGIAKLAQLAEQHFGKAAVEPAGAGLGQRVGGAERQRGDGLLRAFLGQRGDDQHLGALGRLEDSRESPSARRRPAFRGRAGRCRPSPGRALRSHPRRCRRSPAISKLPSASIIRLSTARATIESSTIISLIGRRDCSAGPSPMAGPGGGERPAHGQSLRRRRRVAA